MPSFWLRLTYGTMETVVAFVLVALGGLIISEAVHLGWGWGEQGPQPGFFPFTLAIIMTIAALGVLLKSWTTPDRQPFFEVQQEVVDLLKVGFPIFAAIVLLRWGGLYITSGLYLAFFMAWYGKFRWYEAIAGGIALPAVLWLVLRHGFNIAMPMSVFYRSGILPF